MEERMKVQYWGWKLVVFVILSVILCVVWDLQWMRFQMSSVLK